MTPTLDPRAEGFRWSDHTRTPQFLDAAQVARFDDDGFVLVEDVIAPADLDRVREDIDRYEAKAEAHLRTLPDGEAFIAKADAITFTVHLAARSDAARTFTHHPALVGISRDLVGDDVRLYWDQAVYKKPEPVREFPWHQDNGYAFVEPQEYLTCWVPLTDATVDNGCPWVVPGMHRGGTLLHESSPFGLRCLEDAPGAVPVEARAGSVVVFSSLTPHRTGPNATDAVRKAYIVQYAPSDAMVVETGSGRRVPQTDERRQFEVLRGGRPTSVSS